MSLHSVPKYSRHKGSGQAYVSVDGRREYLGVYGSPESHKRYATRIAEWQAAQQAPPRNLKIRQLTVLYLKFAEGHYRKNGKPTSEVHCIRYALKWLNTLHRDELAADFSPRQFKAVQQAMIAAGSSRTTINSAAARIRRLFKWAVSEELVPPTVLLGLQAVAGLRRGRSAAREPEPVLPVAEADVNAVLPHVSAPVADMIRLQLLTGCRPAEIVSLRPCDVNRDGDAWEYVPGSHKTEHHGRQRRIYFGPRAQAILAPYLDNRPADAPCFSPVEAEAARRMEQRRARKTRVQPSQRDRRKSGAKRRPRDMYDVGSYRRAIHRGCMLAGIAPWAPNRLRHSRATDLRRRFGLEAAQVVLGHSGCDVTQVYAERDFDAARAIMADVG